MGDRPPVPLGPTQVALSVAALAGLVLLITLGSASADGGPSAPRFITEYGPALFRAAVILVAIAEALVVVLVLWALWPDGEKRGEPRAKRSWLAMTIASLIQLATALAFLWYVRQRRFGAIITQPGDGFGGVNNIRPPGLGAAPPGGTDWLTGLVVLGVLGLVGWRLWRTFGPSSRRRTVPLAESLDEALERSLEDLESDPDSRRAVIAAYARMNAVLAAGGLPRQAPETALEYLARVLANLQVPERSVRRLTDLFQYARFSPHDVEPAMKADAIEALGAIRAGLGVRLPLATPGASLAGGFR